MIARILFALAATASIPAILGPQPAHAAVAPAKLIQMEHISVEVIGTGSPVILIPGLSSPRAVWDGVAPELAKSHSVYLVQVNGFGGDDPRANLKPGVLEGVVADLHTLIGDRKIAGAAVIGHSMGGLAGLMLAARHPASVGRLMVVDALPWFGVLMAQPGSELTVAMVEPRAAQMRDTVTASYGKPPSRAAAEANVASLTLKPESRAKATEWAMAADPRVTALALYEDLTTDMRSELKAIRAPATIVYAWNSQYPTKDRADAFFRGQYASIPNVTYVGIGDSAHFVMLDQPAAFAAALAAFLAG
ncbi:MAG: alpha/beta hydrolase [Sphingomonas sp.]|uniref:alpha/beta fold hydrolase n=1 Tax=Sphingomonas sp. TaxID=28214 RepID=UPI00227320FF|nr:alpha/beta hydrolase [Sphingomonas sp.]MCX8475141.1 alpha/beta hydrolase [Sphingomonas sp.]